MGTLVLIRHGQSQWNLENRFTGWWDVGLSDQGRAEARTGGALLAREGLIFDTAFTSLLTRANATLNLVLEEMGQTWVPVTKHWRLNERHYGSLTGLDKAETKDRYGEEQFMLWRRSYATPPPPMAADHPFSVLEDPRYAHLDPAVVPATECLADVVDRLLPYWYDFIAPPVRSGQTVLVAAHGNSLRALIKHLESIPDADIAELEIPTGVPVRYDLDRDLRVVSKRELGDPDAIAAAAEAVRRQGDRKP